MANEEGTEVRVPLEIGSTAATGTRVIQVTTESGTTSAAADPGNTINIVDGSIRYLDPFISPTLGVQVGRPPSEIKDLFGTPLEVVLGTAISGFTPGYVEPGQSLRLQVFGHELSGTTELRLLPAEGISVNAGSLSATSSSVSIDIVVAPDAPLLSRRIELLVGGTAFAARTLLQVRSQPPVVTALTPNWLLRDQTTQTIAIQGARFSQATGARLIPDDHLIIEELSVISDTSASLRLRTTSGAQVGLRVVQLLGLSE